MPHLLTLASAETPGPQLLIVLAQLALILGVSMLFVVGFRRLRQPAVVGQIAAGIFLGPSVFGHLEALVAGGHPLSGWLFNPAEAGAFSVLSQIGLILLMFMVGLDFQFHYIKSLLRPTLWLVALGLGVPLALGVTAGYALWPVICAHSPDHATGPVATAGFAWFLGTAIAITALPVLARILTELGIYQTRLGTLTMGAAALNDTFGWVLLAAVCSWVQTRYNVLQTFGMIGYIALFAVVILAVVRPLARWAWHKYGSEDSLASLSISLVLLFLSATATHLIGISPIFGAFLLGVALSERHILREHIAARLDGFLQVFFLPIFFTYAGLRTDIGTLHSTALWAVAGTILVVAIVGKFTGSMIATRINGMPWRESTCVGALMNTRGLMELVVANLGYDLHVIPQSIFCTLILMTLVTTLMTTPLVLLLKRSTELEEPVLQWAKARPRRSEPAWRLDPSRFVQPSQPSGR